MEVYSENGGGNMILTTIQSEEAFNILCREGSLKASSDKIMFRPDDKLAHFTYKWMSREMHKRIEKPPVDIEFPMWAWYQWEGKKAKIDMRRSGYAEKGSTIYRIVFQKPESKVLLSDFDLWHVPLNGGYLAKNEDDEDKYYEFRESVLKEMGNDYSDDLEVDVLKKRILESWNSIFDIDCENEYISYSNAEKSIQGTFWELKLEYILCSEVFTAR